MDFGLRSNGIRRRRFILLACGSLVVNVRDMARPAPAPLRVRRTASKYRSGMGRKKKANYKPGRLHTRPPLDRMQQIFAAIKRGDYPGRERLATDIEVTTKTIQRDIDYMRDFFQLPIDYCRENRGYTFSEPVERFPMVTVGEDELVSIFVAQKALTQYVGTPFEAPLRNAFEKLSGELKNQITISWADLDSAISFRNFEAVPAEVEVFRGVSRGTTENREITFQYKKLNSTAYQKRRIHPYHLACIQNQWYCFGYDLKRDDIRTFVLPRMRQVEVTDKTFDPPSDFKLKKHLRGAFSVFTSKGDYTIRIWFDAFAAQLIRERTWHPTQKIRELDGGELELSLTLNNLMEIEPWVLSWGQHAKVVAPADFKRKMRATTRMQAARYEE